MIVAKNSSNTIEAKAGLVSIIVPIYNIEKYLTQCIDSILSQTFTNFELILVDDGSTDLSGQICDNYSGSDSRVRVVHQENSGASGARNKGMSIALGEFIMFVDGDDVVHDRMVDTLFDLAAEDVDVVSCGITDKQESIDAAIIASNSLIMSGEEAIQDLLYGKSVVSGPVCKLINRRVLSDISFDESVKIAEDILFNVSYLLNVRKIIHVNSKLYFYRKSETGVMREVFSKKRMDGLCALESVLEIVNSSNDMKIAAEFRLFLEALLVSRAISAGGGVYYKQSQKIRKVMMSYRKSVLLNNRVRLDNRFLALLSYISVLLAIRIFGIKYDISSRYNK